MQNWNESRACCERGRLCLGEEEGRGNDDLAAKMGKLRVTKAIYLILALVHFLLVQPPSPPPPAPCLALPCQI